MNRYKPATSCLTRHGFSPVGVDGDDGLDESDTGQIQDELERRSLRLTTGRPLVS
jgi:hypothetical protein